MSNNIEKDFVPYEESLELKELGFNQYSCLGNFADDKKHTLFTNGNRPGEINAPTFSQAFRFFRENYNLPSNLELLHDGWDYVIYTNILEETNFNDGPFSTYEEAELACLKRLIKIANELE